MPYQRLLEELVSHVPGALGALMLDCEGEVVVEAGARDYRHRLIGAYQGIHLMRLGEIGARVEAGAIDHIVYRYEGAAIILKPLKDGYYIVLSVSREGSVARGLHTARRIGERLAAEI